MDTQAGAVPDTIRVEEFQVGGCDVYIKQSPTHASSSEVHTVYLVRSGFTIVTTVVTTRRQSFAEEAFAQARSEATDTANAVTTIVRNALRDAEQGAA